MPFARPTPFKAALDSTAVKRILPTSLKSAELSEIHASILERARFSAQTTNAHYLQKIDEVIDKVLQPREVIRAGERVTEGMGMIEAKRELSSALESIDYRPLKPGSIEDLGSDARLNLVVDTNVRMAQGYGGHAQGMDPDVLDAFPAQELFRAEDRQEPRDWQERWAEAGGELFEGRMVALKTDPIWEAISEFGLPYPPFAFNSGMDVQDVDRAEAEELGLLEPGQEVEPEEVGFNDDLQMSAEQFGKSFLAQLREDLGDAYAVSKGVLRLKNRAPLIHASFQGLPLSIEAARGAWRAGTDAKGRAWSVLMPCDYGRLLGTNAKPGGEHLNVFVGPDMSAPQAFLLEQMDPGSGRFDEPKAFLGFGSLAAARAAYLGSFADGLARARMGPMVSIPMRAFKAWVKTWSQRGRMVASRRVRNAGGNCGTGAGGFQPGNECGKGGGAGDDEDKSGELKEAEPLSREELAELDAISQEQAVATIAGRVRGFNKMSADEQWKTKEEIRSNTEFFSKEALRDVANNVNVLQFGEHGDARELWGGDTSNFNGIAFYNADQKGLFMMHGGRDDKDDRKVLSHELAHALDRKDFKGGRPFSHGEEFFSIHASELKAGNPIGDYAASTPSEGFAEAVAYVHRFGVKAAREKIPRTIEFMIEKKVIAAPEGARNRRIRNRGGGKGEMRTIMVDGIAVDCAGAVDEEKLAAFVRRKVAEMKES